MGIPILFIMIPTKENEEKLLSFVGVFAEDDEWDSIEKSLEERRSRIRLPISLDCEEE